MISEPAVVQRTEQPAVVIRGWVTPADLGAAIQGWMDEVAGWLANQGVTASGAPSRWRWSCFKRRPSGVRVSTQVRERSSPTWNGMRSACEGESQPRTCITSGLPSKASGVVGLGTLAMTRPAKACPQ